MIQFPKTLSRNGWTPRHGVAMVVMLMAGIGVTLDAWLDIWRLMVSHEEFSHLFLVIPVALWLAWIRRGRLRLCQPTGQTVGLLLISVGWLLCSFGYYNSVESLWHGGSLLVVVGCLVCVVGSDALACFLPCFVVLLFLVPVPGVIRQTIAIPLQGLVARTTQFFFELIGIEIQRAGSLLSINGIHVAIAEACNGMRMVFALALVSYCFAFSLPLRLYVRVLILVASPISALLCNVIRTIPTVWAYGHYPNIADGFHAVSGWVMLLAAFGLLLILIKMLKWSLVPITRFTLAYE